MHVALWAMLDREDLELLDEIGEAAGRIGVGDADMARHELEVLALFDRCRSTFGAIRWLLRGNFAHEAVTLGRSLFTESLMLAEVARADEPRRVELVVGWALEGLADFEGILKEGRARGDDTEGELKRVVAMRDRLEKYATGHGARVRRWKPDEKELSDAHGRGGEYLDFRMAHHFVHGSALAAQQRYSPRADGIVVIGGAAADTETWGKPAGFLAGSSLIFAARAACTILREEPPGDLDALAARLEERRPNADPPDSAAG